MNINETNKYLTRNGCWWFDPWWEADSWFREVQIAKSDFLDSIAFLKIIFTSEWVLSLGDDPLQHPFLQMVHFGQGLWQITALYSLADRFQCLQDIDGFAPVLANYKSLTGARSADLETFVAHVMAKECQDVSFIRAKPKRGRTPDIFAMNNGSEFVIECKTVSASQAETWVKNYGYSYTRHIMDAVPENFEVIFRSTNPEIDPDQYGYPSLGSYELAATIDVYPVIQQLERFRGGSRYVDMGYPGQLCMIPSGSELRSSISMPSISQAFIGRRLVGNAIKKANLQISEYGKPGIVAVSYGTPPDAGALQLRLPDIFRQYKEEYRHLMGVLVFPAQNILEYIPPIWVINPHSDFNAYDYGIPDLLKGALDPIGA